MVHINHDIFHLFHMALSTGEISCW